MRSAHRKEHILWSPPVNRRRDSDLHVSDASQDLRHNACDTHGLKADPVGLEEGIEVAANHVEARVLRGERDILLTEVDADGDGERDGRVARVDERGREVLPHAGAFVEKQDVLDE